MKTARETATQLGTVGVWSADPERMTAADARRFANEVESLGFKTLWIQESLGSKEVFAHAGILLAATKTLIVASGIANIWARDPVAMANGAKTLSEAYPDRFLLGLGVSHKPSVAIRGGTYRKPLEHMRAYLDAMDAAPFVGPNRDEPPAPLHQDVGERAPTGADLNNSVGKSGRERVDDSLENSFVGKEMLSVFLEDRRMTPGPPASAVARTFLRRAGHAQLRATTSVRSSLLGTLRV